MLQLPAAMLLVVFAAAAITPIGDKVCCMAMIASCLACNDGVTIAQYCADNPTTQGCNCEDLPGWKWDESTCAEIEQVWKNGVHCSDANDGHYTGSDGTTASEACCACGGGRAREADPPDSSGSSGLPAGAVAGIAVGTVAVVGLGAYAAL